MGIGVGDEPNLHAYRYAGSPTWEEYSTVDTVNNTVTAYEVTELGIWGLGIADNQPDGYKTQLFWGATQGAIHLR